MQYEIEESNGNEGYPKAENLWLKVLPPTTDLKKKFPWYYNNKHFPSRLYLLREHGKSNVVGAIGSVSRFYNTKENEVKVGLCSDFAVDKDHQTVAPALQLLKSLVKDSLNYCDILLGFPNNKAVLVMRRAGFHILGELPRYALIISSQSYINKVSNIYMSNILSIPIDIILRVYFFIARSKNYSSYTLNEISTINNSFDAFWREWSDKNNFYAGKRDAQYIQWRYLLNPLKKSRIFTMTNRKTKKLCAYAVIRENSEGHWHIFDFLTLDNKEILKCLLQKLISTALKEKAPSLSLEFFGNPDVNQILRSLRFSQRVNERRVIVHPLNEDKVSQAHLYDVNNWHITSADELG